MVKGSYPSSCLHSLSPPTQSTQLLLQFRICSSVLATDAVNIINVILKPARKTARTTQRQRLRLRLRGLSLALECLAEFAFNFAAATDRRPQWAWLPALRMSKCLSVNAAAVHAPGIQEHYQGVLNYSTNRGRTTKKFVLIFVRA